GRIAARLTGLPNWPKSVASKFAPSPPETYRAPSGPNFRSPMEWLGYCWHQSLMSTCSVPVHWLPLAVSLDSRALTTQLPPFAPPSMVLQLSLYTGAVRPSGASYVYSTYTDGSVGKFGASASPSRPRSHWS